MRILQILTIVAVSVGLVGPFQASARTLTLGSVSDNIKQELGRYEQLAEYLESELSGDGITAVEVSIFPSSDDMAQALRDGRVDLYFDSPLVAARVALISDSEPFLRRWKRGVGSYHSVIIVRTDSGIHSLLDLAGKRIAFQEPDSTSGFMLPAGLIRGEGAVLRELPSRAVVPADHEVGYVFSGDDKNTVLWLHQGWVDAGATDPERFGQLDQADPGSYRIVARSIEVPRQVVIRRKDLEAVLCDRIIDVLVAMEETERGRKALHDFNETTRFDHFPDGVEATFQPIYELLGRLEAQGVL